MCVLVKNRDILNESTFIQSLEDRIAFKKLDEVYQKEVEERVSALISTRIYLDSGLPGAEGTGTGQKRFCSGSVLLGEKLQRGIGRNPQTSREGGGCQYRAICFFVRYSQLG
jgi:hypothetical protein